MQCVHFLSRCFRCFSPRTAAGVPRFQNRLSRRVLQTLWELCDVSENTIRTWHFDIHQCISFHIYLRDRANMKSICWQINNNVCHWISLETAVPNKKPELILPFSHKTLSLLYISIFSKHEHCIHITLQNTYHIANNQVTIPARGS